jgi:deoxycytidine triphosphate deaminase
VPSFDEAIKQLGFLTDRNIAAAVGQGFLLEQGTWDQSNLRHASYTLRLGGRVEVCRAANSHGTAKEFTLVQLSAAEPNFELRPGDTAMLHSLEHLRFPDSILGFTVARGLLFAEGLCPENTYVDPGFTGTIYTTVTNVTSRVVQLHYGMPLTRLFFFHLTEPVQSGYRAGSALGISQQLKSVRVTTISTPDQCVAAKSEELLESVKLIPIGGLHAAESFSRLLKRQREMEQRLLALAAVWPVLLVLANNSTWVKENLGTFVGNVAASIFAALLMLWAPKLLSRTNLGRDR